MTKLKVKASSKPKSKQQEKDPWSKSKPTTSYGRFSSRWLEGSGLAPSTTMAGLAALGVGGLFPAVSHFAPALRSLLEYRIGGSKDKSGSSRAGDKVDAVSVSRAANATQGINTLTKITKKGFADVLKAMGATPQEQKKKKSIWSLLGDALTGAAGAAGGFRMSNLLPAALLSNRTVGGLLLRTLALGAAGHYFANKVRGSVGLEGSQFTGGNIAYAIGDTIAMRRSLSAGKNFYKAYKATETVRRFGAMRKAVQAGRTAKVALGATMTAMRAGALATAAATSVATFGLSLLVEEVIMKAVVEPLVHRYVQSQVRDTEIKLYTNLRSKSTATYGDLHKSMALIAETGGTNNLIERGWEWSVGKTDWLFSTRATKERPHPEYWTPEEAAEAKRLQENIAHSQTLTEKSYWQEQFNQFNRKINKTYSSGFRNKNQDLTYQKFTDALSNGTYDGPINQAIIEAARMKDSGYVRTLKEHALPATRHMYQSIVAEQIHNSFDKVGGLAAISNRHTLEKMLKDSSSQRSARSDFFLGEQLRVKPDKNDKWATDIYNVTKALYEFNKHRHMYDLLPYGGMLKDKAHNEILQAVDEIVGSEEYKRKVWDVSWQRLNPKMRKRDATPYEVGKLRDSYAFYAVQPEQITDTSQGYVIPELVTGKDGKLELQMNRYGQQSLAPTTLFTKDTDINAVKAENKETKAIAENVKNGSITTETETSNTLIHRETTSLIDIQNQLDSHIVELTGVLTGRKVETINDSGNPKDASDSAFSLSSAASMPSTSFDGLFKKLHDLNEITMGNPRR